MQTPSVRAFARLFACLLVGTIPLLLVGCGGGSSSSSTRSPNAQTRAALKKLQNHTLLSLAQGGVNNATLNAMRANFNGVAPATSNGATTANLSTPLPMTGGFIANVAAKSKSGRARSITRMVTHRRSLTLTRDTITSPGGSSTGAPGSVGGSPGGTDPGTTAPTFYYDEYLALWVDISDSATQSLYSLYEDEAKTKPAGNITTTLPSSSTYPQVYSSSYTYTAGAQKGAHGSYVSTQNQDGSGSSIYQDTFANGDTDSGESDYTAAGDFTWKSDSNFGGAKSSFRGTFHSDGSGSSHSETSDGYVSDYTYRADGSGEAHISGPDPGLPATVVWDALGNTIITYADGTVEKWTGWGYGDGGDVVPVTTVSPPASTTNSGQ